METYPLTPEDRDLIKIAQNKINARYRPRWHMLAAALRTKEGKVYTGLHIDAYVSAIAICAEQVAIGTALTEDDLEIDTIVAVRKPAVEAEAESTASPLPVTPCGRCRELILDYGPNAWLILREGNKFIKVKAGDALPMKYTRPGKEKKK